MSEDSVKQQAAGTPTPAPKNSEKAKRMNRAAARHIIPFLAWIAIMLAASLMHLTPSSGTEEIKSLNLISDAHLYAVQSVVCLALFLLLKPWRYHIPLKRDNILPAIIIGLGVFVLWVGVETQLFRNMFPSIADFYETWCVKPFGKPRAEPPEMLPYAPETCGWPMTLVRLCGSAFLISVFEEFFWRGWLIRFVRTPDFLDIDAGEFHAISFFAVAIIFGLEHNEWVAGILTGIIYGLFFLRTKDVWATSIAHIVTNLTLGIYVIGTGNWHFW